MISIHTTLSTMPQGTSIARTSDVALSRRIHTKTNHNVGAICSHVISHIHTMLRIKTHSCCHAYKTCCWDCLMPDLAWSHSIPVSRWSPILAQPVIRHKRDPELWADAQSPGHPPFEQGHGALLHNQLLRNLHCCRGTACAIAGMLDLHPPDTRKRSPPNQAQESSQ